MCTVLLVMAVEGHEPKLPVGCLVKSWQGGWVCLLFHHHVVIGYVEGRCVEGKTNAKQTNRRDMVRVLLTPVSKDETLRCG